MVTPNGKVIVAGGYHAESGIFFTCSEDEARAIVPDDLSEAAVRDAYLFLAQELFVDVALHDRTEGMAALVALPADGHEPPRAAREAGVLRQGPAARQRQDHPGQHDRAADHPPVSSRRFVVRE